MTEGNRPRQRFIIRPVDNDRNTELQRRAELRRNYLVPIYFMHTSDVPRREARAALLGVADALRATGQERQVVNFGSQQFGQGAYSSPNWYIEEAFRRQPLRRSAGYGPQIDVHEVGRLFTDEPFQEKPHWEVMVVNQDLNAKGRDGNYINFVFGATDTMFPSSVQSVTRLMAEVPEGDLRDAMVRRLLRHEVGHMFGLPTTGRRNTEEKLGAHCTNPCTMRQGMSIPEWADLTVTEHNNGIHFCGDCTGDLAASRSRYRPLPPQR
ncbi:MAG: hypothetical protein H0W89_07190 [Candidatus Levybacteria bacterium]|nr:hypothetical protein [Candidatus Levybacteria bacterium]